MTSTLDGLDTRAKAAAILSGRKLQMLEDAGLAFIEQSELDRYRKVEAAAKEICGNWQMGRPNYWELYKDPPQEFLKLHDVLYPDASDGREWALVDKRRLDMLERIARIVSNVDWDVLDCGVAVGQIDSILDYAGLQEALDELEAMERDEAG